MNLIFVHLIATTLLLLGSAWADLTDGLTFYHSFDRRAEADSAAGDPVPQFAGTDLLLMRPSWRFAPGKVGEAISLPEKSSAEAALVFSGQGHLSPYDGSLSLWVQPRWAMSEAKYHVFAYTGFGLLYKYTDTAGIDFATKDAEGNYVYGCGKGVRDWQAGQWRHLAITWDLTANRRRLYIDGALASEARYPVAYTRELCLAIGSQRDGNLGADALMDELCVYDRALEPAEVKQLFAAGNEGRPAVSATPAVSHASLTLAGKFRAGMTAHLPFDDSVTADASGKLTNVSLVNTVTRASHSYSRGVVGQAVSVPPEVAKEDCLNYSGPSVFDEKHGTLSMWVRPRWGGDDVTHYHTFFATDWFLVYKYTEHRAIEFAVRSSERGGDYVYGCGASIEHWRAGEWHHIAATWDTKPRKRALYLDGQKASEIELPPTPPESALFTVGSNPDGANSADGLVDEVYVWNRALQPREIYIAYCAGLAGQALVEESALKPLPETTRPAQVDWDVGHAYREVTSRREKICLNGLWRFRPIMPGEPASLRPEAGWGYLQVPGSWTSGGFPIYDARFQPTTGWFGNSVGEARIGWYEREFNVPAAWRGCAILLRLMDVGNVAAVYCNDKPVGEMREWEDREFNLSSALQFGRTNRVTIRVRFEEGGSPAAALRAGLIDDVWLERVPPGPRLAHVGIHPSVRQKLLRLRLRLTNADLQRRLVITGSITHAGKTIKHFGPLPLTPQGQEAIGSATVPWRDPHLWFPDDPYLYDLQLQLRDGQGNVLDEPCPERFGFRELWIADGQFMLNGSRTFLVGDGSSPYGYEFSNCTREFARGYFEALKAAGGNMVRACFPWDTGTNFLRYMEVPLQVADETGMMFLMHAPDVGAIFPRWDEKQIREGYERRIRNFVERYENHPSVMLWYINFNYLLYPWYIHPAKLADISYYPKSEYYTQRSKVALESAQILRRYDDSRPVFQYSCGNLGPIMTMNLYLGHGIPVQEQEDWLSAWSKAKPKPVMPVEIGFPVVCYWYARKDFPLDKIYASEKLYTEYAAMHLGDEPYRLANSPQDAEGRGPDTPYGKAKMLYTERIVRAWRGYGLSGICPHAELSEAMGGKQVKLPQPDLLTPGPKPPLTAVPSPSDDARAASMRKTYALVSAWIAGPRDRLTSKDHSFRPEEAVEKQIVAVNDSPRAVTMQVTWELANGGRVLMRKDSSVNLAPGARQFVPVRLQSRPIGTARLDYELRLRAAWRGGRAEDVFHIESIPAVRTNKVAGVVVLDPKGLTTVALHRIGVSFGIMRNASDLEPARVLIIGREALSYAEVATLLHSAQFARRVKEGLNVVVFEQTADALSGLNLRADTLSFREAFVRIPDHPAIRGLSAQDFHHLRGDSDLIPPYPDPQPDTDAAWPRRFWKWGNKGVVCTFPVAKPHFGNFRTIIDCGFDLEMAALFECIEGKGRITFCQLDVTNRCGSDPVSTRLVQNLIAYGTTASVPEIGPAQYIGGAGGKTFLQSLRVHCDSVIAPQPQRALLIGEGLTEAQWQQVEAFVQNGGAAVLLPRTQRDQLPPSLMRLSLRSETLFRDELRPSQVTEGLGPSDLFFKRPKEFVTLAGVSDTDSLTQHQLISVVRSGKGMYVLNQIDPGLFTQESDLKKWDDFSGNRAWVKALRVWSTLLTNLGVEVGPPATPCFESPAIASLDLSGKWRFHIDPDDVGSKSGWEKPDFDDNPWQTLHAPGMWEEQGVRTVNPHRSRGDAYDRQWQYDGVAWYRKKVCIPESFHGKRVFLDIAAIDDFDTTFFDGVQIGATGQDTPNWYIAPRHYEVPDNLIHAGREAVIAIRVDDNFQAGGIRPGPFQLVTVPREEERRYAETNFNDDPYKFVQY